MLVSSGRLGRPWQGSVSDVPPQRPVAYDATCYLCPGNQRAVGERNPAYSGVYLFDNDFPALTGDVSVDEPKDAEPLFSSKVETGRCRVMCFSPDHGKTLSQLSSDEMEQVVSHWRQQSDELGRRYPQGSVQIFENKGEMMGCSNPHPHCQIWAQSSVPDGLAVEIEHCSTYFKQHNAALLVDYARQEQQRGERVVLENEHFVVVVPFWASWPFETLVLPRFAAESLVALTPAQTTAFAAILRSLSRKYDNLFDTTFPYSSGIHQLPVSLQGRNSGFTWHMHFYPPLLRSAQVRKFMVGYEMLAEPQRDITPERAAELLRECADRDILAASQELTSQE